VFKKNISDGAGSPNGSNGTPLDPPLFWLDNIFNMEKLTFFIYLKAAHKKMLQADNLAYRKKS
jgi:hypothetical protein